MSIKPNKLFGSDENSQIKKAHEEKKVPLSTIPPNTLALILSFLSKEEQATTAQVSRQFAVETANAMQQNLYEDHAGLMAALKPLIDTTPEFDLPYAQSLLGKKTPPLECFLTPASNEAPALESLLHRFDIAREHQNDSRSITATILHRSLGLPLEDMMRIASSILPFKSKFDVYETIYEAIHLIIHRAGTGNHPHLDPIYRTPLAIDALYKIALHSEEPLRSNYLTEVSEKYLNIGDLSKAEEILKQVGPSDKKAKILLGIANKYLEEALDEATPYHLESYNLKKARELLKESLVANKDSNLGNLLSRICNKYIELDRLKEAENTVKELHLTGNQSSDSLKKISEAYEKRGEFPKALELAKEIQDGRLRDTRLCELSEECAVAKDFENAFAAIDEVSASERSWRLSQLYFTYSFELIKELKKDDMQSNSIEKLSRFEQLTEKYVENLKKKFRFIRTIEDLYDKKNPLETLSKTLCMVYLQLNDLTKALSILELAGDKLSDDVKSDLLNSISEKHESNDFLSSALNIVNQIPNKAIQSMRIEQINRKISEEEIRSKRKAVYLASQNSKKK